MTDIVEFINDTDKVIASDVISRGVLAPIVGDYVRLTKYGDDTLYEVTMRVFHYKPNQESVVRYYVSARNRD